MALLKDLLGEIVRSKGAPYLAKLKAVDRGFNNWRECSVCHEYTQGVCKDCQRCGKLVSPLGANAFADALKGF